MVSAYRWWQALGALQSAADHVVWRELLTPHIPHSFKQPANMNSHPLTAKPGTKVQPPPPEGGLNIKQGSGADGRDCMGTEADLLCDLGQVLSLSGLQLLHKNKGVEQVMGRYRWALRVPQRQGGQRQTTALQRLIPLLIFSGKVRPASPSNVERKLLPLGLRPHLTDGDTLIGEASHWGQAGCGLWVYGSPPHSRGFSKICVHQSCS